MASVVKPLDGAEGYLRWKESMLLRLHTVGVAHVLSEDRPAGDDSAPAAKKWARDDALCRGHILAALSDRVFPDYVRHATAREAWRAVARTYDLGSSGMRHSAVHDRKFYGMEFDERAPLLEQIAHAEALAAKMMCPISDADMAYAIWKKLPGDVANNVFARSGGNEISMEAVWDVARIMERLRMQHELQGMEDDQHGGLL